MNPHDDRQLLKHYTVPRKTTCSLVKTAQLGRIPRQGIAPNGDYHAERSEGGDAIRPCRSQANIRQRGQRSMRGLWSS